MFNIDRAIKYGHPLPSTQACHVKSHSEANVDILINANHTVAPGRCLLSFLFVFVLITNKCVFGRVYARALTLARTGSRAKVRPSGVSEALSQG